jgi:dihydropteroate synthase
MKLLARQFEYLFPRPALVMGIVNATPDSFSDGGRFADTSAVVAHAMRLIEEGAGILDVGGESTRPGAVPVSQEEELRRVMPVLAQLAGRVQVPISIDTTKPEVARAALAAGASLVNDVGANRNEETMWRLVAETGAGYVCLHMQGTPQTMQLNPVYGDVVREVTEFFFERLKRLNGCGVRGEQVIFDPGIGFGKTLEHNLELLGALPELARLGRPLLLGVSRKSFMARLLGTGPAAWMPAGLACASLAVEAGAHIIRAHDAAETVQAIRMAEAILARRRNV